MLFNGADLTRALGADTRAAGSLPDGEVSLRLYFRWSTDRAGRLDSAFAFAIWDWGNKTLYAARNRLGERPLFYHRECDGEFTSASELKAVPVNGLFHVLAIAMRYTHISVTRDSYDRVRRSPEYTRCGLSTDSWGAKAP